MSIALAPADDIADPVGENRMRENGRGAGAVTDHVARLFGGLTQHARTKVLFGVLEIESPWRSSRRRCRRSARPISSRSARISTGPKRDADSVREWVGASQNLFAGSGAEEDLFVGHWITSP